MADSIREQIMKRLVAVIQGITVDNGYGNTILPAAVQRFRQAGIVTALKPYCVLIEEDDTPKDEPLGLITHDLRVVLAVVDVQQPDDPRSSDELMNSYYADFQKALMTEAVRNWTVGGIPLGVKTSPLSCSPLFVTEGVPDLEFHMECTITYRHRNTDPTALV